MIDLSRLLAAAGTLLALASSDAFAQQDQFLGSHTGRDSSYEQRLTDLEAELSSLRSERLSYRAGRCSGKCGRCRKCCPSPCFDFSAELLFLSPHSTNGLGTSGPGRFPNNEVFASWRTSISYTFAGGVGRAGSLL